MDKITLRGKTYEIPDGLYDDLLTVLEKWDQRKYDVEQDEIFLLSKEEYERFKSIIPLYSGWWWLRSPGDDSRSAANVDCGGSVNNFGYYYCNDINAVRPALRIRNLESSDLEIGKRFVEYDFPWVYLGDGLAIAEVPIARRRFDAKNNGYETSEIRQFLLDWLDERR